jgi:hypothetical protein
VERLASGEAVHGGIREQEHRHRRGHAPLPRGRAPLGAHGGEPDAVDVRGQAAEHQRPASSTGMSVHDAGGTWGGASSISMVQPTLQYNNGNSTLSAKKPDAKKPEEKTPARGGHAGKCVEHLACATRGGGGRKWRGVETTGGESRVRNGGGLPEIDDPRRRNRAPLAAVQAPPSAELDLGGESGAGWSSRVRL